MSKVIVCPVCNSSECVRLMQRSDAPELFDLSCGACGSHATIQLFADPDEITRLTAERDAAILDIPHECATCRWERNGESLLFCKEPCPHCDPCMKDNYNGGCYCSGEGWEWSGLGTENAPEVEK